MKHYLLSQAWFDLDLVASLIIDESLKHTFIPRSPHVCIRFYLIQGSRVWPSWACLKANSNATIAACLIYALKKH